SDLSPRPTRRSPSPWPPPPRRPSAREVRATPNGPASSPTVSAAIRASPASTARCRPTRRPSPRATPPWCSRPTASSSATSSAARAADQAGRLKPARQPAPLLVQVGGDAQAQRDDRVRYVEEVGNE